MTDTGPLHLAIAMGVPTISFSGPNTPRLYGPLSNKNISIFMQVCSLQPLHYQLQCEDVEVPKANMPHKYFCAKELLTLLMFLLKNVLTDIPIIKE